MTGARRAALAAALVAAAVALPSVGNGFVQDDEWIVQTRPDLRPPAPLGAVLALPYWPPSFGGSLWRPAVLFSYALDYRVSTSPHWFHLINVVWAALAAAALAALAAELAGPGVGLAAGLLFAVHPVHVEATASVVGRAELMAAAGYAVALLCALASAGKQRWLAGVLAGAVLAIASKEHAATLPVAIVVIGVARRDVRRLVPAAVTAAVPVLLYFAARGHVAGASFSSGGLAPGLGGLGLAGRAWAVVALSVEWWRLTILPLHLSADYSPADLTVSTALDLRHILGVALWAGAVWGAWRLRRRTPWPLAGVAWLALTIAPVSNVLVPTELLVAERTLYLPSWGLCLALAAAGALLPWSERTRATVITIVLAAAALRSVLRVPVWHDGDSFYAALQRDAPRSYRTLWLEGDNEFRAGHFGTGEHLLQAAALAAPQIPGPREDLAQRYAQAGLWRPAVAQLIAAAGADTLRSRPWTMLPAAIFNSGDTVEAARAAEEALARFPGDSTVVQNARAVLRAARATAPPAAPPPRRP